MGLLNRLHLYRLASVLTLVYGEMQLLSIAMEVVFPGHFSK